MVRLHLGRRDPHGGIAFPIVTTVRTGGSWAGVNPPIWTVHLQSELYLTTPESSQWACVHACAPSFPDASLYGAWSPLCSRETKSPRPSPTHDHSFFPQKQWPLQLFLGVSVCVCVCAPGEQLQVSLTCSALISALEGRVKPITQHLHVFIRVSVRSGSGLFPMLQGC